MTTCWCTVPSHEWGTAEKCDASGPATRTHWGNGGARLLTPEAFTLGMQQRQDSVSTGEAAKAVDDYAALDRAIGSVLFNVSNFPEKAQSRLLGQNMRPLTEKLIDAVQAAGFRRMPGESESTPE